MIRLFRPRTISAALASVTQITDDLTHIARRHLARATRASNRASDMEDQVEFLQREIEAANEDWRREVEERDRALDTIHDIQVAFGLKPRGE